MEQKILRHSYDRTGQRIETDKTLVDIPGERFDPALPVYILTSRRTGSAAEGFAYMRTENPVTKTDFENVGVIPHIKVAASKALEAAIKNEKK